MPFLTEKHAQTTTIFALVGALGEPEKQKDGDRQQEDHYSDTTGEKPCRVRSNWVSLLPETVIR